MDNMLTMKEVHYTNKALEKATARIQKLGMSIRTNLYEVAAIIANVADTEAFKDDGFENVHEWTNSAFGIQKTTSYNMLKIGREYVTEVITDGKKGGFRSNLLPLSVEDFTTSQVERMLPLGHERAFEAVKNERITPDMSLAEVRKAVKELQGKKVDEEPETEEPATEEHNEAADDSAHNIIYNASVTTEGKNVVIECADGRFYMIPAQILNKYKVNK